MLKAYDYAERPMDNKLHEAGLFNLEKKIAMKFVLDHPLKNTKCSCTICASHNVEFIFSRWDVNYYICNECNSIFVPVKEDIVEQYMNMHEMREFRLSDEYQSQATDVRDISWNEMILWLQFRSYRYLEKNKNLNVIDYGNKYQGLVNKIKDSDLVNKYELRDSILSIDQNDSIDSADIVLYLNQMQHVVNPIATLKQISKSIKDDGLLVLNTRLGSGFDILTLKGGIVDIFPYEHITLPSKYGLEIILEKAGFELLEITTPGTRDMNVVMENKERIEEGNFFIKYLLKVSDERTLQDFQQFLQKSCLSSFAQVIARKK